MSLIQNVSHLFSRTQRTIRKLAEKIWSFAGALMLLQSILPREVTAGLSKFFLYRVGSFFDLYSEMKIEEYNKISTDVCINSLYLSAEEYVGNLESITEARRLRLNDIPYSSSDGVRISPDCGEVIWDCFQGVTVWWTMSKKKNYSGPLQPAETKILTARAKNPTTGFFQAYLSHIERSSTIYNKTEKNLKISQNKNYWCPIRLSHPATFETLALDPKIKQIILSDLNRFRESKEFYERIGRAWKRGYFLYGPPGTGKTSLVVAIAKYMRYDIFELKLSNVKDNTELRNLLAQTCNQSVIIIEDIDGNSNLTQRGGKTESLSENNVSLSGVLNALDGLQSCAAEERIFIITTNNKDMLDSALLRPGRMDLHIHLSFCTFPAFKTLARNYLKVENHELFSSVKEKIVSGVEVTPAEIIQVMANKVKDPHKALSAVICVLDARLNKKEGTLLGKTSTL